MAASENNTLRALANKIEEYRDFADIFSTVCDALDIKWEGKTPKALRKQIAKDISPDKTKDTDLKEARTHVLAHINRATDIAEAQNLDKKPLSKPEAKPPQNTNSPLDDYFHNRQSFGTRSAPSKNDEKDDEISFKNLSTLGKLFFILENIYAFLAIVAEGIGMILSAIIHSPFFVIYIFAFIFIIIFLLTNMDEDKTKSKDNAEKKTVSLYQHNNICSMMYHHV